MHIGFSTSANEFQFDRQTKPNQKTEHILPIFNIKDACEMESIWCMAAAGDELAIYGFLKRSASRLLCLFIHAIWLQF